MKKVASLAVLFLVVFICAGSVFSATQSERDEIVAKVNEVGAMLEKEGKAGLEKIPTIRFGKDNYVYVGDMNCTIIAHGWQPHLVGKNIIGIKDDTGNKFMAKLLEGVKSKQGFKNNKSYFNGETWVTYRWPSPESKTNFLNKIVFAKGFLMGDENVFVTAGMYE
ncbi:MAG TPA: cache domain-containing protein [Syntrophales bacterium]|nr:cache domain-containing protein [Syntrophales bacterium]HQB30167.1 cache domain-containing protein [Syntrophales bacterium]